jgi:hypothetical protein
MSHYGAPSVRIHNNSVIIGGFFEERFVGLESSSFRLEMLLLKIYYIVFDSTYCTIDNK